MRIFFPGSQDAVGTVEKLRRLADDIERLTLFMPSDAELRDAPELERWTLATRSAPALLGCTRNHPLLGDRRVLTSEVFAIDGEGRWARTFSRFYRLVDQDCSGGG